MNESCSCFDWNGTCILLPVIHFIGITPEGEVRMKKESDARALVDRIDTLRGPYHRNAIQWMDDCAKNLVDRIAALREPYRGHAIEWIEDCAKELAERIDAIREPYRRHAIEWIEDCAQVSISDLSHDLQHTLRKIPAVRREAFYFKTKKVLDGAVLHFGR